MPNFLKLDKAFRLSPWNIQTHADYVAGQYGAMMAQSPEKAKAYLAAYRKKEEEFDAAYEEQCAAVKRSQTMLGQAPQELLPLVKIDWNPEKQVKENVNKEEKKEAKAPKAKVEKKEEPKDQKKEEPKEEKKEAK